MIDQEEMKQIKGARYCNETENLGEKCLKSETQARDKFGSQHKGTLGIWFQCISDGNILMY